MWTPADRALVGDFGSGQALTDDQFRLLEPLIPPPKRGGRPRTTDMRKLLDGLFYLVRTGCQWRHLPPPPGFPALAHRVRLYARLPARRGVGEYPPPLRGHAARGRRAVSRSAGSNHRYPECEDHGERRPARLGCRKAAEEGRKRHVAVDTDGLLLGILVHAADIQDADGLGDLLKRLKPLYVWLRAVFADSIYNRLAAWLACYLAGLVLIIVRRPAGTTGFVVQPRRWASKDRWLVRPMAPAVQGLRDAARGLRGNGHPGRDPPHAPPPRPSQSQATARPITFKTGCKIARGRKFY